MDLSRNHWIHLLSVALCLMFSTVISQFVFQEDEGAPRLCPDIGPFEHHVDACLQNRILQLNEVAELSDGQTRRLRVIAKGVMKRVTQDEDGTFYFGNPLKSKFWTSNLDRVLSEEQLAKTQAFDDQVNLKRQQARARYGRDAFKDAVRANFVVTNMQKHLYLTDEQSQQVTELLKEHLSELNEDWDPMLEAFLEAKRPELEKVLAESQLVFIDGKSLINGIGRRSVWDSSWQKSTCTDCHA